MNFGDILDKWEKQATKAGTEKKVPHPLNDWLDRNETDFNKLHEAKFDGMRSNDTQLRGTQYRGVRRSRLLRKKPDASIDLHGLNRDEAWTALDTFFENSRMIGHEKLLIIHGKGNHRYEDEGVLGDLSRRFIETCSFAGESGHCSAKEGGRGATWVILKEG